MNERLILLVDDEPALRLLASAVLSQAGMDCLAAKSAEEAFELLEHPAPDRPAPRAVLLDIRLPGMDGLAALSRLRAEHPELPVVMLTANDQAGAAVTAMKQGALDYLVKPVDNEELVTVMEKALAYASLLRENDKLKKRLHRPAGVLIGDCPAMEGVRRLIEQVGPSDVTVLITGESGTGKELVAEALHAASARQGEELVRVNCAALPAELLESELFGYKKGAFTGATKDKPGKFQLASGGTLFLDEVGELPLSLQPKLLRALQERKVDPLGGTRSVDVDVRLVAATNRDLRAACAGGEFREDLYYRLAVVEINLPSLRERKGDLPLLTAAFLDRLAERHRKGPLRVEPGFFEALGGYDWPGNVRELQNVLERAVVLSRTQTLGPDLLPPHLLAASQAAHSASAALAGSGDAPRLQPATGQGTGRGEGPRDLELAEREALQRALAAHGGHRGRTAEALGVSRRTLQYKLRKHGLARPVADDET